MTIRVRASKASPSPSPGAVDHASLAAAVEHAADGIVVTDIGGTIRYVNPSFTAMTGFSSEEAVGRNSRILKSGRQSPAFYRDMWSTILSGQVWRGELTNRRKDGSFYVEESRISPVADGHGGIAGFVSIKRDLTEQRQAERRLRESEQSFREVFACAPAGMCVTGMDGRFLQVNEAHCRMLGYSAAELLGSSWIDLVHPEDREESIEKMTRMFREQGGHVEEEVRNIHRRGHVVWVRLRAALVRTGDGRPPYFIVHVEDITERKRAEAALRESEERFRSMADSCPAMRWVSGPTGKIEFINRAYREFGGITCEEAQVGEWRQLLHPGDAPQFIASFDTATREHIPFSAEARVRRADGAWRLVGTRAEPRFSPDGAYQGHIGLRADITDRRKAEQEQQFQHSLIRTIHEVSLDGIVVVNDQGSIVSCNNKFFEVWQIPQVQVAIPASDLASGETGSLFRSACLERVKDPDSFLERMRALYARPDLDDQCEIELKDGRTLERFSTCLRDEKTRPLARAWFFRDITGRKQSEQALRESEDRFRIMADGCPMPMWVTDVEGRVQFINRALREFTGTGYDQVEGDKWRLFAHPEDAPQFIGESKRVVRERVPFKTEARFRRADGEWRWLAVVGEPRFSPGGEFLGHIGLGTDITERKQTEQALRESEDRFRAMADGCPMPLWITNADGEIQFINRIFMEFYGGHVERIAGSKWQLLLHPDDAPEFLEGIFQALHECAPFKGEVRVLRKDGEYRWLAAFVAPRFSLAGEFLGHVGLGTDVTDRRETEQALQSSEEKFRQLAENIRQVFWLAVPGSKSFLYVSPAYEQVWGRSCESFYRDPDSRLEAIHPDDLEMSRQIFSRQMQGEEIETEYRILTPDGQQKWIRARTFPIRDESGQLIRVAGIAEDMTEQKRHEEELTRAREDAEAANRRLAAHLATLEAERKILRTFIDNVPDFMYVKDTASRFIVANRTVARWMGGNEPESLLGKTDFDFYPRELAERFFEDDQQVIRSGQPIFDREEMIGTDETNQVRYLLTSKVPLFDAEAKVAGVAGMGRDITMHKTIEDALRESNRELQEATDWANKMALEADAANRSKSEFLANMSHEIRTPMNGILGMNGLLLGSDLDAEQRHYAEVVDSSAKSLLKVIDDILDFSKVEAGKLEIDTVDFNLHMLMGDFAETMAGRVEEKPVEFVCAVAPEVWPHLQGDPGRLRQVLLNLVGNAMKFTHHGEVVVRVEQISETEGEVGLRFSVRDTGIGIPADKLYMLFTSFTQVDASTTRKYGGTGLGLAISKKLVELMEGMIGVESKEGLGSEFWFTLRFGKQTSTGQVTVSNIPVKGTRILVVDDNATNREVLTAQMQSWGAVVAAVESGPTALACLRYAVAAGSPFQLAVLDMMMPGMDGAALGRAILAEDDLKSIPLIMMTSLGQRGDAIRFKEIGFAAYLVKPVRQSDLYDCLVALLTGEPQKETRPLITRYSLIAARRSNARILLVEDNPTNQEVAGGMLLRMGWSADVAGNGRQALKALETGTYDLVLMDIQMPEMDGFEATRRIRDLGSAVLNHDIPIIATTAHAMDGDAERCLAAGMSDYVSKPIDPKILLKTVEKWLARKSHAAPPEAPPEPPTDNKAQPPAVSLVFNREEFLARMMDDEVFAREVVEEFLKDLPSLLSELRELGGLEDLEPIWKHAHKMKGSAANVGGEALRDVALQLEQSGRAGDLATVVRLLPEVEAQITRLSEALQQWMG